MSPIKWQVQVSRGPDNYEGVRADNADVEKSGALTFWNQTTRGRRHVITYGARAWFTYFREEEAVARPSSST